MGLEPDAEKVVEEAGAFFRGIAAIARAKIPMMKAGAALWAKRALLPLQARWGLQVRFC